MSFYTVYQPIFLEGKVFAYEALLRGEYPPEHLFRMAKARKMLNRLDLYAMKLAIKNYRHAYPLAINMFPSTLQRVDIYKHLKPLLKDRKLIIEISEHEELIFTDNLRQKALELSSIGVQLALDYFGKGYNNLLAIDYLQPKYIKLDANLINNLSSPTVQKIIQSMVGLTCELNIELIAEGVETKEQMKVLQGFGVHYLQGYYLGKPGEIA